MSGACAQLAAVDRWGLDDGFLKDSSIMPLENTTTLHCKRLEQL